jgi:hypothetical protein
MAIDQVAGDDLNEQPDFAVGESGDNGPSGQETIGASYGIKAFSAIGVQRGEPLQPEPYLMPTFKGRNGGTERVADSPPIAPLNGLSPGVWGIATALPTSAVGEGYGADKYGGNEQGPFKAGIGDSFPEGCPIPVR